MTPEDKLRYMTETPLPKLVAKLSLPALVSMLITSFYNMADTYFVGMLGSASASGAVGVIYPYMSVLQAVGFMFGHGSGNYVSRKLGAGENEQAERMASVGFFSAFIVGVAISLITLAFGNPMVRWLGSTETIAPYAREYLYYLLPGIPFLVSSLVLNNQLRFQGSAFYAMIGITSGALLNVVLDPILIFNFGMGVSGAALATSVSQMVGFVILLAGTRRGGNIRLSLKRFKPSGALYREVFRGGVPSLARQGLNSLSSVCLNLAAGNYGDAAIAALSIVTRIMMMAISAVIGFGQGFQPICGFNYGAKHYDRVRDGFWFCVKLGVGVLIVVTLLLNVFAPQIVSLFLAENVLVQEIGAETLRYHSLLLPLFAFICLSNMMLQTMGMAWKATLLAMARQGLFLIPAVFVMEHFFQLPGIEWAQTVADLFSFLLALPLSLGVLKELKEKQEALLQP